MSNEKKPPGIPSIVNGANVGPINNLDLQHSEHGTILWADSIERERNERWKALENDKHITHGKTGKSKDEEKNKEHDHDND